MNSRKSRVFITDMFVELLMSFDEIIFLRPWVVQSLHHKNPYHENKTDNP